MAYLKTNMTLTKFAEYLNANMVKKSGKLFTTGDIQGYVNRNKLPEYLGGGEISMSTAIEGVKLYNLKK